MKRLQCTVKGMSCAACVSHVERAVKGVVGSDAEFTVSLLTNSLTVLTDDAATDASLEQLRARLAAAVHAAGYELTDPSAASRESDGAEFRNKRTRLIVSAVFTALLMYLSMGGMLGMPLPPFFVGVENALLLALAQLILTLPVVILNFKFFKNGASALFHLAPNMDSLIAVGSGASLVYGIVAIVMIAFAESDAVIHSWMHDLYFESAAMILTLVSLGKLLEGRAKDKAADSVKALATLTPQFATVLRKGEELTVPASSVVLGDTVLIRAGELIPVDGEVLSGTGAVDESALTGESMPVEKEQGSTVRAACVLLSGALTVRATGVGEDTSLSRIIRLLEDTAASKAPISRIADRVSAIFVPAVMAISAVTLLVWLLCTGNAERALRSAIAVLVISCPCALGLATPTAITVGIGRAARRGILFRNAAALEKLCHVKTVVLDKTGTVTEGKPTVTDLYVYGTDPARVLQYAASVERFSAHPLANAIQKAAADASLSLLDATDFEAAVGMGACATVAGVHCAVQKPSLKEGELPADRSLPLPLFPDELGFSPAFAASVYRFDDRMRVFADTATLEASGKTVVFVLFDGTAVGLIAIADRLRPDSKVAAEALKTAAIETLMLTGDNARTAAFVARDANLGGFRASLLPEDKERIVGELSAEAPCAMVGDGINDAPALVRADVGIAIGAGTEVAIDSADVVLSGSSLSGVVEAIGISRACIRIIKQNLFWALFYNAICIPVAAGVFYPLFHWQLTPMLGSVAMSFSSVCVVLNALRLRRIPLPLSVKETADVPQIDPVTSPSAPSVEPLQNLSEQGDSDMLFKKSKTYTISVDGMMCPRCVAHVQKALEEVKGVTAVTVSLEQNQATVTATTPVEPLLDAVKAAGYGASLLS